MIHHHRHHDLSSHHQLLPFEGSFPPVSAYSPASPSIAASPQINPARQGTQSPYPPHPGYDYSSIPSQASTRFVRPQAGIRTGLVSPASAEMWGGEEVKEKQRCTYPDCGKVFKDLKAHMLTHQTERPEKCPIQTCEYHVKGFARKYDKNRHTLTHYKGTMVCGFCPGSGSAAEKSFNRADVFKRHLTALHGVEQNAPNCRKKAVNGIGDAKKPATFSPDATGKCSTCSQTFANAQEFYEHLDDCVLRIVQQEDPIEANNAKRLAEMQNDSNVIHTLERNCVSPAIQAMTMSKAEEGDDDTDEKMTEDNAEAGRAEQEEQDRTESKTRVARPGTGTGSATKRKGNPSNGVQKSRGMTASRGGMPLTTKKSRKNHREYPLSWGFDKGQMTMKKRVLTVFDGPRRLAKDDMMLSTEHEVRIKLPDGKSYVTDLDILTMKRAEGFHGATEAEKGPWVSDDPTDEDVETMKRMVAARGQIGLTPYSESSSTSS